MPQLRRLFLLALFVFGVPATAWLVSRGVTRTIQGRVNENVAKQIKDKGIDLSSRPDILEEIRLPKLCDQDKRPEELCREWAWIDRLGDGAFWTALVAAAALVLIALAGNLGRTNRRFLLALFRPGLVLTQVVVVFLVVTNALLAIGAIYYAESIWIGRLHVTLLLGIALVALVATFRAVVVAFRPLKRVDAHVVGKSLARDAYPKIWDFVDGVARQAGTAPPDHIVVGLDPTFFVTEANVSCADGQLKGRSLFLSAPFCRILAKDELTAILAHEMGHFVGEDTAFSRNFYPIYRGAADLLIELGQHTGGDGGLGGVLALLPSYAVTGFFLDSFATAEKTISRERELKADEVGARIGGKAAMGGALIKTHAYGQVWGYTLEKMVEALREGKQITNVSSFFDAVVRALKPDFVAKDIGETHTAHPTDSHPPLAARLKALGLEFSPTLSAGLVVPAADLAAAVLDCDAKLEETLSDLEHGKLVQMGALGAPPPQPTA